LLKSESGGASLSEPSPEVAVDAIFESVVVAAVVVVVVVFLSPFDLPRSPVNQL